MRFCNNCKRMTAGQPSFCPQCGASYGVKLCPRSHPNPRSAEVCSQCGSKDLSTPHQKLPFWLFLLLLPLRGFGWLILFFLIIWSFFYVRHLLYSPYGLLPLMSIALLLGFLLYVWTLLGGSGRKRK